MDERTCAWCQCAMLGKRAGAKYCSRSCKGKAAGRRRVGPTHGPGAVCLGCSAPLEGRRLCVRYHSRKCKDNTKAARFTSAERDARRRQDRQYRADNAQARRESRLYHTYGLTPGELSAMIDAQSNRCHLCEVEFGANAVACVDHDHASGSVRSILCSQCNVGLGMLKDDADLLARASTYLTEHKATLRSG